MTHIQAVTVDPLEDVLLSEHEIAVLEQFDAAVRGTAGFPSMTRCTHGRGRGIFPPNIRTCT